MKKNHYQQNNDSIIKNLFGILPDKREVFQYTLNNHKGMQFSVIDFGATVTSLKITKTDGQKIDIVLGFETIDDYVNSFNLPNAPYLGTIIGRYAGRINNAKFHLDEKLISLNKNHGEHHLHGGNIGFSRKIWTLKSISNCENPSITFEYISLNNEENFPGELSVELTYTLTEENEFKILYQAISTKDTVVNLTHHSYFNLDGHSKTIVNQELFVNSSRILETNGDTIPTGFFIELYGSLFDFTTRKKCPTKIDNTFVLDNTNEIATTLYSKKNNLKMSVYTNQPAVHIYVGGNCFDQIKGKENTSYHSLSGICFETQNFPDAPNHAHFPCAVLKKGEIYTHNTLFKFENL